MTQLLSPPDLLPAFPHAIPLYVNGGETFQDDTFDPGCGYTNRYEASILYTLSKAFPGVWIELGSHTGWTTAHIAAAGNVTHAVEPQYGSRAFYERAIQNWERAGVRGAIVPWAATSQEALSAGTILSVLQPSFAGAFVDGDHDGPQPLRDVQMLAPRMEARSVIALHDFSGQPVRDAVDWLRGEGWSFRLYESAQGLAVCWRGRWEPIR